jgi:L,D-transpeptidase YcbB
VWLLRQRPGPSNSLGLVKFELPNPYDLSARNPGRNFSRVPSAISVMAAYAPRTQWPWLSGFLRDNPAWTEERIREAMNGGETLRVNIEKPIPARILYRTAVVQEDGEVHFLKDLCGHAAALESALEPKGIISNRER